jgi:peptidoglycan/xylan/chitin deacetylase (PgdA/CDA1 family)
MLNIMKDFVREFGPDAQPELHATSFVIASPEARRDLDRTCLAGRNWFTEDWWPLAIASGLMSIANHSWDHVHPTLGIVAQREQKKGTFTAIDTYEDADAQIRRATDYIMQRTEHKACPLFAYPYGECNDYLTTEYLPNFRDEHRIDAAFGTSAGGSSTPSGIWNLSRIVCGYHWKSGSDLAALLAPRDKARGMEPAR